MIPKNKFFKINLLALKYFCLSLNESREAKKYLLSRIDKETIKKFRIGYAPPKGLMEYLSAHGILEEEAKLAGLIGSNDNNTIYDIFTKRVMFPITYNNHVLGFGGRTIVDHSIKYLNSRENVIYHKSEILYGMGKAKKVIDRTGWALLVEGYFDVLVAYSYGIKNVVASCGTAFNEGHALLLRRWADEVYICFDGDTAGRKAAEKAEKVLKKYNIYGKSVMLPKKHDPASFLQKYGRDRFLEKIN